MGTLASAIAQLENTNPVYNNPGAISGGGDTGSSFGQGIGIYSTLDAGNAALSSQLSKIYAGSSPYYPGGSNLTLDQFGSIYGKSPTYGQSLGSILGVPSTTPLSQIPSGATGSSSSPQTGILGILNKGMNTLDSITGAPNADNPSGGQKSVLGIHLQDVVVIIVGIILIAAGLFSFKQTQTVIETGTKLGKKAAEVISA